MVRKYSQENGVIGERVRLIRLAAGLTQEQFAARIDVTSAYVSEVERGIAGISIATLRQISREFKVSCDRIVHGGAASTDVVAVADKLRFLTSQQVALVDKMIDTTLDIIEETKNPG